MNSGDQVENMENTEIMTISKNGENKFEENVLVNAQIQMNDGDDEELTIGLDFPPGTTGEQALSLMRILVSGLLESGQAMASGMGENFLDGFGDDD